jgi:hypothetical protein
MALVSIEKQTEVINQNTNLATVEDIDAVRFNMLHIRGSVDKLENSLKETIETNFLILSRKIEESESVSKDEFRAELRWIRWLLIITLNIIIFKYYIN